MGFKRGSAVKLYSNTWYLAYETAGSKCFLYLLIHVVSDKYFFQFLRCREAWLTGILDDLDQRNAYEYLKGMVNCHRMHLFDVVNQYRAIFADDTSGSEENHDGGLLFSWATHQITSHLKMLKVMLPKIAEGGSLSNILDQCMVRKFFCSEVVIEDSFFNISLDICKYD